jgi:hypothetical protein
LADGPHLDDREHLRLPRDAGKASSSGQGVNVIIIISDKFPFKKNTNWDNIIALVGEALWLSDKVMECKN